MMSPSQKKDSTMKTERDSPQSSPCGLAKTMRPIMPTPIVIENLEPAFKRKKTQIDRIEEGTFRLLNNTRYRDN